MKLDDILDGIREDAPDAGTTRAAAHAVRARLGLEEAGPAEAGRIESCAGYQARIADLVAGRLAEGMALLVQDHTRECVPCRRALLAARAGAPRESVANRPKRAARGWTRYAAAAAAVALLVLGGFGVTRLVGPGPQSLGVVATDGGLWRLDEGTTTLLTAGSVVQETDTLRTERGGGAVLRMADGSRIELRENTQMRVERRRDGATIRLAQGGIIVVASKQGSGRLDVATNDARVSVKGTIFTVNAGLAGSRAAVLEGAVQFESGGDLRLLQAGDQTASRPGLEPVPLREAFAWSRDAARYDVLLAELKALHADLDAGLSAPPARHDTRLLDRAPAGTVLYVAIPNLTQTLADATAIFRDHLDRSDALRAWWSASVGSADAERELERGLARLSALGRELGDEIVVTFAPGDAGRLNGPVFMAQVRSPESFLAVAEREGLTAVPDLELRIDEGVLVAGPRFALSPTAAAGSAFAATAFHDRLAEVYRDGTGWIFGADIESIVALRKPGDGADKGLVALGADTVRHLIVEREDRGESARTAASLSFAGPRHGVAAWLAEPGAMGGLAFVSPDANFVASVRMKEPGAALRELFATLGGDDPEFAQALDRFHEKSGIDPLADLADPLGGELTVALDGPVLPAPSWKVVAEVYDPARLQDSFAALVERINEQARQEGHAVDLALSAESGDGRTWHTLSAAPRGGGPIEVHYTFDGGYLVAAPSRALVRAALQTHASGVDISSSARFRALLPGGRRTDFSAIVFENLAPMLSSLAGAASAIGERQREALAALGGDDRGHLIYAFASPDRIEVASDTSAGLGLEIGRLFALVRAGGPAEAFRDGGRREETSRP